MKLKELINEDKAYTKAEDEIKKWVEKTYPGLSIDFMPHLEIVKTNEVIEYAPRDVQKIVEVVNLKIDEILEAHAEEIYIAERLTRIWKKHPEFNPTVNSIEELKRNSKFLKYLDELVIKRPRKNKRKEVRNGKC